MQTFLYGAPTPNHFAKFLVDSTTTVISIVAMMLMVKRYQEQWTLWIVVNIFSIHFVDYHIQPNDDYPVDRIPH